MKPSPGRVTEPGLSFDWFVMPSAPPKPCVDCGALVFDGTTRCLQHKRDPWVKRAAYKRESGRRLQRKRESLFKREPLCRECRKHGRVALAVIRDHIKPLAEEGTDDDDNVQPLCQACSDEKTEAERRRGLAQGGGGGSLGPGQRKPSP